MPVVVALALAPVAVALASAQPWSVERAPSETLSGVAATSASNAWAVGQHGVLHWNGRTWSRQASPAPRRGALSAVAASSRSNAWTVGYSYPHGSSTTTTLVLHYNGRAWRRQPTPNGTGRGSNQLNAVATTSPSNAWAVGEYFPGAQRSRALILHWNGRAWRRQAIPNPREGIVTLSGVTATSRSNAWAVGSAGSARRARTLVLHWNGRAWRREAAPDGGAPLNVLAGVTSTSPSDAWTVGDSSYPFPQRAFQTTHTLILHWDGRTWHRQASPDGGATFNELNGVATASPSNAWAVGDYYTGANRQSLLGTPRPLILHWDGTSWQRQASPHPGSSSATLAAVTTIPRAGVWGVGSYPLRRTSQSLILRCCSP